jgi:RNA polymerase sigma-70 factor (ECF subfamily)
MQPSESAWRLAALHCVRELSVTEDDLEKHLGSLMGAAQDGDNAAYQELLRLAVPIIVRVVGSRRYLGLEIDDVVQDVLVSLHTVRHTYDPGRPFTPWLATIARHRLVDAHRRRGRIAKNEENVADLPETFSGADTKWEESSPGDPELLKRAIAELPARQRKAVELLKLKQLSLKEASAASGMSIAALKVAVHRGVRALRRKLAPPQSNE